MSVRNRKLTRKPILAGYQTLIDEKLNPVDSFLKPEEAVNDALVCVWQRIVALITSWDAELKIITINHIVMIIDH